jgi:hypothetical protein
MTATLMALYRRPDGERPWPRSADATPRSTCPWSARHQDCARCMWPA